MNCLVLGEMNPLVRGHGGILRVQVWMHRMEEGACLHGFGESFLLWEHPEIYCIFRKVDSVIQKKGI